MSFYPQTSVFIFNVVFDGKKEDIGPVSAYFWDGISDNSDSWCGLTPDYSSPENILKYACEAFL
jgi:hypothetical protein